MAGPTEVGALPDSGTLRVGVVRGPRLWSLLALVVAALAALVWATLLSPTAPSPRVLPVRARPASRYATAMPISLLPAASASVGASEHGFWPVRDGSSLLASGGGIHSTFAASGASLRVPLGTLGLSLAGVGRGSHLQKPAAAVPTRSSNEVLYSDGSVSESFRNGPYGIEQGFTVRRRPSVGAGPLVLALGVRGSLLPRQLGSQIVFRTRAGATALRYGQLGATDAGGHALPARMQIRGGVLRLLIDDSGARYPIHVDPFVQAGNKFTDTEKAEDADFGFHVALSGDGNTALIGGQGAAWVFVREVSAWKQQAKLTGSGGAGFGDSVALSSNGNTAIVGAEATSSFVGAAFVFARKASTWEQQAKLTGKGEVGEGAFGSSVALSGNGETALVGARNNEHEVGKEVGAAWVFTRTGSTWQERTEFTDDEKVKEANLGSSVALSAEGTTALIGAERYKTSEGAAWVFTGSGASWTQQEKLTGESGAGAFGHSVALSANGDTALVGANHNGANSPGAAWVFIREGSKWKKPGTKLPSKLENGEDFGDSVALSGEGNTAIVGGEGNDGGQGAVWVFTREGAIWTEQASKLTGKEEKTKEAGDAFGAGVSLSTSGGIALIGGPKDEGEHDSGAGKGAAWVFVTPPTVVTEGSEAVTASAATVDGTVDPNGAEVSECKFEYGTSEALGASATCASSPGSGTEATAVSAALSGLEANTTYYYRVAATNLSGTGVGAVKTLKTLPLHIEPPASVAFTITPDSDPLISLKTYTFAITDPEPGVTYQWDFGDKDSPLDSAATPFIVEATGDTVTYAYPSPPVLDSSANGSLCPGGECTDGSPFAVYLVRAQATVPQGGTPVSASPQRVVVIPVQRPTASFQVLRSQKNNAGTGVTTAVTKPVTIVPQADITEPDVNAGDKVVREDFWLNNQGASGTPDLTCLSDGVCGHYVGSAPLTPSTVPSPSELAPIAGQGDDGTGALTQFGTPAPTGLAAHLCAITLHTYQKCFTPQYSSPTGGFESFSMNFWNAALAAIGSPGGPIPTLAAEASVQRTGGFYERLPVAVGYPPLTSVNLREANGFDGEQGTGDSFLCELNGSLGPAAYGGAEIGGPDTCVGGCFLGYPLGGGNGTPVAPSCYSGIEPNKEHCGDDIICLEGQGTGFFPIDLAKFGPYSVQHYEDEANFLYNYATVVGVDTPLDDQIGPATGARKRLSGAIVPRTVTMVAYDAEGVASEPSTQSVPLTPASNPTLRVCVEDVTADSPCVETGTKKPLPVPITEGDTLRFKTTGSNGGDDPIAYYSTAVGQPNTVQDCEDGGVPYYETETLRPGGLGETHEGAGANPTELPRGPVAKGASARRAHASTRNARAALSVSKGNGTGVKIEANPIVEYINGAKQTPFPIPDFSDLLSGAFPYHNCSAFAIRTVDPNLAVAPLPKGGPNEIAHVSAVNARRRVRARKAGSSSLPAVKVTPSATAEASGLEFEFPHEGKYSVSVAAYNTSGLGAITRIDGFEATKAVQDGPCEAVNSIPLNIHDPHTHREAELGFSGECVSVVTAENSSHDGKGHPLLYASTTSIDIDGVPLVPQSGDAIVIRPVSQERNSETHKSGREVEIFVAPCKIAAFETSAHTADGYCHQSHVGSVYLSLGGGKNQSPPGIAAWETSFTGAAARAAFGPRAGGSKPVSGCGELPGAQAWKPAKESGGEHLYAAFEGFEVVHSACVEFTAGQGSKIEFHDQLPTAFQRKGTRASSTVRLEGRDVPTVSLLETNNYASVARHHGAQRVIDGSPSTVRAHKAEIGFPPVPNCKPAKHNPNELEIPEGDELGPIEMPVGAHFCYDKATGIFTGNVKVNIPGPAVFPLNGVEVGFEIGHGRLIDAGGEISGNVPIGPVFINELKFDIQTDPTVVAGAIEASIADFLAVEAATVVSPSVPEVAIEGTVTLPIGGFKLGEFELVFHKSTVKMKVAVHEQFGPAELELAVQGAMQFDPEFAFFVEGSGKACLWICLSAKGIVSNIGLAACGEINLLFVTLSAGVGVLWSGPNSGVHVFTGCDLNGYRPPELRNITFSRVAYPARTSRAGPGGRQPSIQKLKSGAPAPPPKQSEIQPGGHETLTLNPGGLCTPKVETGCEKGAVAVQVHSLASSAGVGVAPQVTLTGPAPEDTRVITTPSTPDQFSFAPQMSAGDTGMSTPGPTDEGTAIVDQDPVPLYDLVENSSAFCAQPQSATAATLSASCPRVVTTTILVADPGKGEWTLSVDPESPPVVDVAIAQPEPQVAPIEFNPGVHPVKLSPIFHGKLARVSAVSHALVVPSKTRSLDTLIAHHDLVLSPSVETPASTPKIEAALTHPSAADLDVPAIDTPLLRSVQLKVPARWKGTVAVIDEGAPGEEDVIASHISTSMIPSGGLPILFKPVADFGATHEIKAFLSNEEGVPSRTLVLSSYRAPALPTPSAPSIVKIVRLGSTVDVYFKPGDAPITEGVGLALSAGNGLTIEGRTPFSRLHAVGARHGLGAAAQAGEYMLSIHHVDPTVSVDIALDDSSAGKLSATTRRYVRPSVRSISEAALLGR
jgi:hypothetical protein